MAPSQIYVRNKEKSANEVGLKSEVIRYPDSVEEKTVLEKIEELNNDETVSGTIGQLPLPKHIDKQKVIETITPLKDVDGFHPMNVGNLSDRKSTRLNSSHTDISPIILLLLIWFIEMCMKLYIAPLIF